MYNKKGQAAMEFLMTYGWAILAAIIAIGALAYFGVFTPSGPTATILEPPFHAVGDHAIVSASGKIKVETRNSLDEKVDITSLSVTPAETTSGVSCTANTTTVTIEAQKSKILTLGCTGLTQGERFKGNVDIKYKKGSGTLELSSSGTITEKIIA